MAKAPEPDQPEHDEGWRTRNKPARPPRRFTEQFVILTDKATAARILALVDEYGYSQTTVLRDAIGAGLPLVEDAYQRARADTDE